MKKSTLLIVPMISMVVATSGCAEKKKRIWIEPPIGYEATRSQNRKLYYQIDDLQSGRKEHLWIPVEQTPENLVVEDHQASSKSQDTLGAATRADREIKEGKIASGDSKAQPTLSYLMGLEKIQGLYQQKKYTDALIQIAPLIEQYPEQTRLFVMQGTLFKRVGEKKLAFQSYKKAQKLEKNNPEIEEAVQELQDEIGENL